MKLDNKAGKYKMDNGVRRFFPNKLSCLSVSCGYEGVEKKLFEEVVGKIGGLETAINIIPNIDYFLKSYIKKETILSCQIEGSHATLKTLFNKTAEDRDIKDVLACEEAIKYSIEKIKKHNISEMVIKRSHKIMLAHDEISTPGKYRKSDVFIGGFNAKTASYNPPLYNEIDGLMKNLIEFINKTKNLSPLVIAAIAHAQFEMIHPFYDGNGRIGRMLIVVILLKLGVISKPVLYPSYFFKQHHQEYYKCLAKISKKGDWGSWLEFFFNALLGSADDAIKRAIKINEMRQMQIKQIEQNTLMKQRNALALLDGIYNSPVITVNDAMNITGIKGHQHAQNLIRKFIEMKLLELINPEKSRGSEYMFTPYIKALEYRNI